MNEKNDTLSEQCKPYARKSCSRPNKPETVAFVYPVDRMIVYNRAAAPNAEIYDLCF